MIAIPEEGGRAGGGPADLPIGLSAVRRAGGYDPDRALRDAVR